MDKREDQAFAGKGLLIVKLVVLWLLACCLFVIWACLSKNETFSMLAVDLKSGFADNAFLVQYCKNKLILISVFFAVLLVAVLLTEDFSWTLRIGKVSCNVNPRAKWFRRGSDLVVIAAAVVFSFMSAVFLGPQIENAIKGGWQGDSLIAHACGGIGDMTYTNSLDALESSYEAGTRTIEVDFAVTADDKLVCWRYGWYKKVSDEYEKDAVLTEEEFMNSQTFNSLTPMSLETLFELMKEREDMWIITDTKEDERENVQKQFRILLETAEATDSTDVLDRFVVQLYNYEMYDAVEEIYSFPTYILTLYQLGEFDEAQFTEYCRFCKEKGIGSITMWYYWATPEVMEIAERYGIDVYVHTVNDMDLVEELQAIGVKGFYTDYVVPEMME